MDTIDRPYMGAAVGRSSTAKNSTAPESGNTMLVKWLLHDTPYIAMLLLALAGVILRLGVLYWVILIPVFGVISVVEGWRHFGSRSQRLGLLLGVTLNWCAMLLAIYLLFDGGVQGVMNANASSLTMMILLALGTFIAGVQARVWQICAVGGALFLAVPGLGWLDQSPLLLAAATCVIILLGGVAWWASQWRERPEEGRSAT
jgi:hypothetical protein